MHIRLYKKFLLRIEIYVLHFQKSLRKGKFFRKYKNENLVRVILVLKFWLAFFAKEKKKFSLGSILFSERSRIVLILKEPLLKLGYIILSFFLHGKMIY